jgi:hypothetical protein
MIFVLGLTSKVGAAGREVTPPDIPKAYLSLQAQNPSRLLKQVFSINLNRDAAAVFEAGHFGFASKLLIGNIKGPIHTPALGNWITQLMNKMEVWLTNRTHMIQFCAIGMVIALVIIWWRKT